MRADFRAYFVDDKAKIRRRAVARQGFLTQSAAKYAEKTCANFYRNSFLNKLPELLCNSEVQRRIIPCRNMKRLCLQSLMIPCRLRGGASGSDYIEYETHIL